MNERAGILTDHMRRVADRDTRIKGLPELAERLDVGAKIKRSKAGGYTITIPADGKKS